MAVGAGYILVFVEAEKLVIVPEPITCADLKKRLLREKIIPAESFTKLVFFDSKTNKQMHNANTMPFGRYNVYTLPSAAPLPSHLFREDIPGSLNALEITTFREAAGRIQAIEPQPEMIFFLDTNTAVDIVKDACHGQGEFKTMLEDERYVFITTETVRLELPRSLRVLGLGIERWEDALPRGRTFHMTSCMEKNRKMGYAIDLLKLPPFGARPIDQHDAALYFEACGCNLALWGVNQDVSFLTNNFRLIQKCAWNRTWVEALCSGTGVLYMGLQRLRSAEVVDEPLVLCSAPAPSPAFAHSHAALSICEELTSPFHTNGFLSDKSEPFLHTPWDVTKPLAQQTCFMGPLADQWPRTTVATRFRRQEAPSVLVLTEENKEKRKHSSTPHKRESLGST